MLYSFRSLFVGTLTFVFAASPVVASVHPGDMYTSSRAGVRGESLQHTQTSFNTNHVLVRFHGADTFTRVPVFGGEAVEQALSRYQGRSDVLYAEPDYTAYAYMVPNDSYYNYQWNFDNATTGGIHTESAWDQTQGAGVTVAVIDTGVAYENYSIYSQAPDLAGTLFVPGYDFVADETHPNDENGHGTHVAGTIAQSTNNSSGVAGIAYKASLMPVRVLNKSGSGSYSDVADGIRWAADHGADVINLSLGGPTPSSVLRDAVAYAYGKGVVVVAAAGNENTAVGYPAAYDDYVIAVGATRYDETRASYSNYGSSLDIVAPGGDTSVDQNGDGYGDGILQQTFSGNPRTFGYYFFEGTSMATPHVAGVAALVLAKGNATTPVQVRAALETTADDLGATGRDNYYGNGLLNAVAALGYTPGPGDPPPPVIVPVFSDSFEVSEWNGLWTEDSQNDWFRSSQRASEGTRSAEVDGLANNATLTSVPINLASTTSATVSFDWYIENGLDTGEYVAFLTSADGGATWVERARISGDVDTENIWHSMSIDVSGISNLRLRFQGKMSLSSEDANVDNVKVVAE